MKIKTLLVIFHPRFRDITILIQIVQIPFRFGNVRAHYHIFGFALSIKFNQVTILIYVVQHPFFSLEI